MPRSDSHSIRRIDHERLRAFGDDLGLSLTPEEVEDYQTLVNGTLETFDAIMEYPIPDSPHQAVDYSDRPVGRRPTPEEDPLNAWVYRCEVTGAEDGLLSGYSIGLKDSIALAGHPLTLGSDVMRGFVPRYDATVVRRVLNAGARIVGLQNMESFAFSGSGDTSDYGPVINPHSEAYLAGGSSSGSAAAIARGECDVSIGSDQAGSVRIPSACCGTIGLKPTTGLVPYTGAYPLDPGIDHLGPIANDVETIAKTLTVIAGEDRVDGIRLDPRQPTGEMGEAYHEKLTEEIGTISIGILEDGFSWEFADTAIMKAVREAIRAIESETVETHTVSMDHHQILSPAAAVIATMGGARTIVEDGVPGGPDGWYWTEFAELFNGLRRSRTDQFPPSIKQALLVSAHVHEEHGVKPYALAWNLVNEARREYDRLLADVDVLALPTVVVSPMTNDPTIDRVEATSREWTLTVNTAATNLTGHPAISLPCGKVNGLPVGLMLVGKQFGEKRLLQVAQYFYDHRYVMD